MDWAEYLTATQNMFASALARRALNRAIESTLWRGRVLDLGAGGLRDTRIFLNEGFIVDAIDSAPGFAAQSSIVSCRRKLHLHETSLLGGLPEGVKLGTYDIAMCNFTLPYLGPEGVSFALDRLAHFPRSSGVVTFTLFGEHHENHDCEVLRHSQREVDKIIDSFLFHGFVADMKEPVLSKRTFEALDWKDRPTHWHYFEIFLCRSSLKFEEI